MKQARNENLNSGNNSLHYLVHAFKHASIGMAFLDVVERRFLQVNPYLCNLFGFTENEMLEMKFDEILCPEFIQQTQNEFNEIQCGQRQCVTRNKLGIGKDKSTIRIRIVLSLVHKQPSGNPADDYFLVMVHHLVDLQNAGQSLQIDQQIDNHLAEQNQSERNNLPEKALSIDRSASRTMQHVWSNMAHELRTPLNSIIGFSQVLRANYFGELNEKQHEYVGDILESADRLYFLINDIIDISRIETEKLKLHCVPVSIAQLLQQSLYMIKEKCLRHKITLNLTVETHVKELTATIDERKIKQVLYNLFSNAAEYTPDGGEIHITGDVKHENLIIQVRDTGAGIAESELESIFQPFVHGPRSNSADTKSSGAGLGLPLSRKIIELHGGKLWAESDGVGKGSLFMITLPLKKIESKKEGLCDE